MDTKLKKSNPFGAWLAFFIGTSILIFAVCVGGILVLDMNSRDVLRNGLFGEEKESIYYKEAVNEVFRELMNQAVYPAYEKTIEIDGETTSYIEYESMNLDNVNSVYYGKNAAKNYEFGQIQEIDEKYDYQLRFEEGKLTVFLADKEVLNILGKQMTGDVVGYDGLFWTFQDYQLNCPEFDQLTINLIVAKKILPINRYSPFYNAVRQNQALEIFQIILLGIIISGLLLFIYSRFRYQAVREFSDMIGKVLGYIWIEFKLLGCFFLSLFAVVVFDEAGYHDNLDFAIMMAIGFNVFFWLLWLLMVDIRVNQGGFLSHNSLNSAIKVWKSFENQMPLQDALNKRFLILVFTMLTMFFIALFFLVTIPPLALIVFLAAMYLLYRYYSGLRQITEDIGILTRSISEIKQGNMSPTITISEKSDLYQAACDLRGISDGINQAVEDQVKAEKMKIDLITNVSHDLKTPLTSLISYIDILKGEANLPEHVRDYINILAEKSKRLSSMIRDVFEVSKASSGNLDLTVAPLDLVRLTEQTLADMHSDIESHDLIFKVNIKNQPIGISGDGGRLYRAVQNLLDNSLKYSLPGTRVYIDLYTEADQAYLTIRNIASYEMNCGEEEIIERFVRADQARSSEGSGLGLAIAQSFIEACGGSLSVRIDGDLFKVIVSFGVIPLPEFQTGEVWTEEQTSNFSENKDEAAEDSAACLETGISETEEENSPIQKTNEINEA